MSVVRVRDPYLLGATKWAAQAIIEVFGGVSEETGSVFFTAADSVSRKAHAGASAVAAATPNLFVVADRFGFVTAYTEVGAVLDSAQVGADGNAIVEMGSFLVVSGSNGSLVKVEALAPTYASFLDRSVVGLAAVGAYLYAMTDDAVLITLVDDPAHSAFRPIAELKLPANHGLRDMVLTETGLYLVGTDRLGNGSVVAVSLADPAAPVLVSIDRTESPFVVLTTDGGGHVGTEAPQSPYTTPEIPWQGRTDAARLSLIGYMVARPAYAEVWLVSRDVAFLVYNGIPVVYDGELVTL
jgi:hypothetical protein